MRLTSFFSGLAAFGLLSSPALADDEAEKTPAPTIFDSVEVPPLTELTPDNFEKEASKTKWLLVKHYRYDAPRPYPATLRLVQADP